MTSLQNVRLINANGSAGAYVLIRASIDCRKCTIIEDGSANAGVGQGIQYSIPDPSDPNQVNYPPATAQNTAPECVILPQTEPLILGGENGMNASWGSTLGRGPQDAPGAGVPPSLGTALIWVRSASVTATILRVTESI